MNRRLIGILSFGLILSSCGGSLGNQNDSQVINPDGSSKILKSIKFTLQSTTTVTREGKGKVQPLASGAGRTISYLFLPDRAITRLEMEGIAFPDQRDRFAVFDFKTNELNVYFEDSRQVDLKTLQHMDHAQIRTAMQESLAYLNSRQLFHKWSSQDFTAYAKLENFESSGRNKLMRSIKEGEFVRQTSVQFNQELGQVEAIRQSVESASSSSISNTQIKYASIKGIKDVAVPIVVDMVTTVNLKGSSSVGEVQFPAPDVVVAADAKDTSYLKPNEEVVFRYTTSSLEGKVNLNEIKYHTKVNFENIQVNTLSEKDFMVGEQQ